ncbi:MAG TPA: hypothetical protein VM100_00180 [Longimicrobiales bacterium]|nr:hypothetical protein [Longimicrobiales bacterium]
MQLLNVTRENEQLLAKAALADSIAVDRIVKLRNALNGTAPSDSLWFWVKRSFVGGDFDPLLGVYEAVIQNGSANLIQNDSLRDMVSRVTGVMIGTVEQMRGLQPLVLPVAAASGYRMESQGLTFSRPTITPDEIRLLQNDTELKRDIYFLWPFHGRHGILTRRALASIMSLRKALERELDVPAVEPRP